MDDMASCEMATEEARTITTTTHITMNDMASGEMATKQPRTTKKTTTNVTLDKTTSSELAMTQQSTTSCEPKLTQQTTASRTTAAAPQKLDQTTSSKLRITQQFLATPSTTATTQLILNNATSCELIQRTTPTTTETQISQLTLDSSTLYGLASKQPSTATTFTGTKLTLENMILYGLASKGPSKTKTTKLTLDKHASKLAKSISSLFYEINKDSKLSNVQITIDNRTFYCHKIILQQSSKQFSETMWPATIASLQKINPDHFYEVLRSIYTGEVQASSDNMGSLLTAAYILDLDDLKKVCFQYLYDSLNIDNALLYWTLAVEYQQKKLARKCQSQVVTEYRKLNSVLSLASVSELNSVSSLASVSEDMMIRILSDDNLKVKKEVEACEMLMNWLQVQKRVGSEIHPDHLLPHIRWSDVSVGYVKSKLLRNKTLTSDPSSVIFLSKVITYLVSGIQFECLRTFHRTSIGLDVSLMTFGQGNGYRTFNKVCSINLQHLNRVSEMESIPAKMNSGSSSCMFLSNLYLTGVGGAPYKQAWKWNALFGWSRRTDMLTGRLYHCTTVVGSMLYVLGGRTQSSNTILKSVERFNILQNTWFLAGELCHPISRAAWITYDNSIYLFGGIDNSEHIRDYVQRYNPEHETCTLLQTTMPFAFSYIRAALWDTSVILLGRYKCFLYDFKTKKWQERKQFSSGVGNFALALENSTVFIAGGGTDEKKGEGDEVIWICTDQIKSVPVLDIIEDRPAVWKHHAKLAEPAMIHSFVSISLPKVKPAAVNSNSLDYWYI